MCELFEETETIFGREKCVQNKFSTINVYSAHYTHMHVNSRINFTQLFGIYGKVLCEDFGGRNVNQPELIS